MTKFRLHQLWKADTQIHDLRLYVTEYEIVFCTKDALTHTKLVIYVPYVTFAQSSVVATSSDNF